MNFLELWTCDSGNNSTNYCNREYDQLVEQARATPDDQERFELYNQMEEILFGSEGEVPLAPIYWYTYVQLEKPTIKDTFETNLLDQLDLTKVVEGEPSEGEDG
jgi:oligopeptide transport system substrate-binding protein